MEFIMDNHQAEMPDKLNNNQWRCRMGNGYGVDIYRNSAVTINVGITISMVAGEICIITIPDCVASGNGSCYSAMLVGNPKVLCGPGEYPVEMIVYNADNIDDRVSPGYYVFDITMLSVSP